MGFAVLGAIILLIFIIAMTRIGLHIIYRETLTVFITLGAFRIRIWPLRPKKAKRKNKKTGRKAQKGESGRQTSGEPVPSKGKKKKAEPEGAAKPSKKQVFDRKVLLKALLNFLEKKRRGVTITLLLVDCVIATGDAAKTAILYGQACAARALILALLGSQFPIKYQRINIKTDFLKDKISFEGELKASMRIWQPVTLAVSFILTYLRATREKE